MYIEMVGGSKTQQAVACAIAEEAGRILGLRRYSSLWVELSLKKLKGGYHGLCSNEDIETPNKPRYFEVFIEKKLSLMDMAVAICHELVHVRQYVKRDMIEDWYTGEVKWKGRKISKNTKYREQPWEKEAFALETKLANQVLERVKI